MLGAEFVAAVQVIIYAGAIMVLFIFVIMLFNAGTEERIQSGSYVAMIVGIPGMLVGSIGRMGSAHAFRHWLGNRWRSARTPTQVASALIP